MRNPKNQFYLCHWINVVTLWLAIQRLLTHFDSDFQDSISPTDFQNEQSSQPYRIIQIDLILANVVKFSLYNLYLFWINFADCCCNEKYRKKYSSNSCSTLATKVKLTSVLLNSESFFVMTVKLDIMKKRNEKIGSPLKLLPKNGIVIMGTSEVKVYGGLGFASPI